MQKGAKKGVRGSMPGLLSQGHHMFDFAFVSGGGGTQR